MRNLKKILALVLALVMSLSLMATAGAGSFQDVTDDNPYKTAIDVLDQLKVFQGFEDGSFKPTDTLNRAQAAVLVYRIATGDVEGKYVDNYTYMAQSKFVDLDGYNWAKGYINYCQNAEIVVGTDATHFAPGAKVTGYQLLVMLLRTLGYGKAGEFSDPKGWELQTATIAEREGITKNITAGDFGAAAPRQMVAEILFQGLLTPTVQYTALNGYAKGETLGKKNLGLEKLEGIVMANEYANLTSDSTLADGKTALKTEDKTYTLNITSTLDDIGEYRYTYVIPAASRTSDLVCTGLFGDEANTTWETTDKADISNSSKFSAAAGVNKEAATEEFINFGTNATYKSSDYRIRYEIDLRDAKYANYRAIPDGATKSWIELNNGSTGKLTGNTYEKVINIRTTVTELDLELIYDIFDNADKDTQYKLGEVYVGTQSNTDISDSQTVSYYDFLDTYIDTKDNSVDITGNDNGNWLKVIDNDGDGYADYVFKVVYTMAQVANVSSSGAATLDVKNEVLSENANTTDRTNWNNIGTSDVVLNKLTGQAVASDDELAAGDVVYYAVIDGKAQTYKAEVVESVKIDKVNRNTLTASTTDGTDYVQSEVHEHIVDTAYSNGVRNLVGNVAYDLFLDRGGYLAAFVNSNIGGNYVLLTDGWFMAQRAGDEFAAKVYNRETKEQDDTTITSGGIRFIYGAKDNQNLNNSWGQLRTFDAVNGALNANDNGTNVVKTIVAALDDEGGLLPVDSDSVYTRYTKRMIDVSKDSKGNPVIPGNAYTDGISYKSADSATVPAYNTVDYYQIGTNPTTGAPINSTDGKVEIRALTTTVYYYVYKDGAKTVVMEYEGYNNLPTLDKNDKIEDVYAVGTLTGRTSGYHQDGNQSQGTQYYTADIVVVEFASPYKSAAKQVLIYDTPIVDNNVTVDNVSIIDTDGNDTSVTINLDRSKSTYETIRDATAAGYGIANVHRLMPGLYFMYESADTGVYTIEKMTPADIRDSKFVVGQVSTTRGTGANRYTEIANWYNTNASLDGSLRYYPITANTLKDSKGNIVYNNWTLTDDTKYYSLDYTNTSDYMDRYGALSEGTWDTVLAEQVDRVLASDANASLRENTEPGGNYKFNNNDVLLLTKNGNVVYADRKDW